jgi:hypothetical protein
MRDFAIEEPPLRSELFSADQMEQHGKALAASHSLGVKRTRDLLLTRLAQNEGVLLKACDLLTAAIKDERAGTPAGEWLLDNFHLIEEQIRAARLPGLPGAAASANGPSADIPRLRHRAERSRGDGQVDPEASAFIALPDVSTLTLGDCRPCDHAAPCVDRACAASAPHHSHRWVATGGFCSTR